MKGEAMDTTYETLTLAAAMLRRGDAKATEWARKAARAIGFGCDLDAASGTVLFHNSSTGRLVLL